MLDSWNKMVETHNLWLDYEDTTTKPLMNTLLTNTAVLKYPDSLICFYTVFNMRTRNEARVNAVRAPTYNLQMKLIDCRLM